jgi:hypothetical protein
MSVPTTAASGSYRLAKGGKAALRLIGNVTSAYRNVAIASPLPQGAV